MNFSNIIQCETKASDAPEMVIVDGRVDVALVHQVLESVGHITPRRRFRKLAKCLEDDTLGLAVALLAEEVHESVPELRAAKSRLLHGDLRGYLGCGLLRLGRGELRHPGTRAGNGRRGERRNLRGCLRLGTRPLDL